MATSERESFGTFTNGHPSLPAAAAGQWPNNTFSCISSSSVRASPTSLPDSCNNLIHIVSHFSAFSGWDLGRRTSRVPRFLSPPDILGAEWELVNHRALLACSFLAILAEPAQIVRSSSFCDFLGICCGFFAGFFGCPGGGARRERRAVAVLLGSCCGYRLQSPMRLDSLAVRLFFSNPNLQSTECRFGPWRKGGRMNEWVGFPTWVATYGAVDTFALSTILVLILSKP